MPKLTVLVGLPGSGKTSLIKEMQKACPDLALAVSDYMADSHGNSPKLRDSRHHDALLRCLAEGKDCVIADIEFVKRHKRDDLVNLVRSSLPDIDIHWIYFENDWLQCLKNVDQRAGADSDKFERDAKSIVGLTRRYSIPQGAEVRPAWRDPCLTQGSMGSRSG